MECFKIGQVDQLDEICGLYGACKESLLKEEIYQWGDWGNGYPDRDYLKNCIIAKQLFTLTAQQQLIGAVILNESQSPEWNSIYWSESGDKALIVHAMVIHPNHQNKGYGKKLLSLCEQYAADHGYGAIRLDSFKKNAAANKLYLRFGYNKLGTVIFDFKPENNQEYFCYEKLLCGKIC